MTEGCAGRILLTQIGQFTMESPVITAILVATLTLLGVALTSYAQFRNQRSNQQFQLTVDAAKHERDRTEREKAQVIQRLTEAHITLSRMAREFSITSLDILWRAEVIDSENDRRYMSACAEMDALRAFAHLHEPVMSEQIEQLLLPMGKYWINLNQLLHKTRMGKVEQNNFSLQEAHAAALEIGEKVASAQQRLADLMSSQDE